jgi:hypothetical protein
VHRQRIDETGNCALEMVEPVVEIWIVTFVLDQTAGMSDALIGLNTYHTLWGAIGRGDN